MVSLLRRSSALLMLTVLLASLIAAVPGASSTTFQGSGDASGASWFVHGVHIAVPSEITVTLSWDDPAADLNVFLRPPGSNGAVAYDNGSANPKVLVHEGPQTGWWTVAVKVKSGASAYTVVVDTHPTDPEPNQPLATPTTSWQTDGRVRDMLQVGDQLWVTGHFDSIRPPGTDVGDSATLVRPGLAVLDATTGEPAAFTPPALGGHGWALAASPDGGTVYVGGTFRSVDGIQRKHIAAVDTASGALSSWDPGANSLVRSLLTLPDGTVVAGGQFRFIGGTAQRYLAAIDPSTGVTDPGWAPLLEQQTGSTCPPRCEPFVDALELSNDGALLVGGHFGVVNGTNRTNGAAIDPAAPTTTLPWDPNVFTPSTSSQLSVLSTIAVPPAGSAFADRLLLCGDFKRVNGTLSSNIGAVDATSGVLVAGWDAQSNGGTPACAADATTWYVGGHFSRVGTGQEGVDGPDRHHLAALDPVDGTVLSWNPGADTALGLHTMRMQGQRLYVGGDFTRTGAVDQQGIAHYSTQ